MPTPKPVRTEDLQPWPAGLTNEDDFNDFDIVEVLCKETTGQSLENDIFLSSESWSVFCMWPDYK